MTRIFVSFTCQYFCQKSDFVLNLIEREPHVISSLESGLWDNLKDFFLDPEIIRLEIENFEKFTSNNMKIFVLSNISYWYREKHKLISLEINALVQYFALHFGIEKYSTFDEKIKTEISKLQSIYVIYNYPTNLPNFWTELFKYDEEIINNFLLCFTNDTSILSINRIEQFSIIKQTMNGDGTSVQILEYIFNLLTRNPQLGLKILQKFCYWCDIDFTSNEDAMSLLQSNLNQLETVSSTMDLFRIVALRIKNPQSRDELINSICDPEKLSNVIEQNPTLVDLHKSIGSIIYTYGTLSNNEKIFEFAVQLLQTTRQAIIEVAPFIYSYINQQKETFNTTEIIEICYNSLSNYYNEITFEKIEKTENEPSYIAHIIASCWKQNQGTTKSALLNIIKNSEENLPNICTECHIARNLRFKNTDNLLNEVIIPRVINIFQLIQLPFTQTMIVTFYEFCKLCFDNKYHLRCFPPMYSLFVMNNFLSIVFDETISQSCKYKFLLLFEKFVKEQNSNLEFDENIMLILLNSDDYHYVKVGCALMMMNLEYCQQNTNNFLQSMPITNILIENFVINKSLTFIGCNTECTRAVCQPILGSMFACCQGNDESLSLYAQAVDNVFGDESPEQLASVIDYFSAKSSVATVSRISKFRLSSKSKLVESDIKWFNKLLGGLFTRATALVEISQSLNIKNQEIDEAISNVSYLFAEHFGVVDDNIKKRAFEFAACQYKRTLDSLIHYQCALKILIAFLQVDVNAVFEVVSPAPLSICFAINIDSMENGMQATMNDLRKLLNKLSNHKDFGSAIELTSSNFGIDSQIVNQFIEGEIGDRLFFQLVTIMRISSGV